jgi:hypothetical protein
MAQTTRSTTKRRRTSTSRSAGAKRSNSSNRGKSGKSSPTRASRSRSRSTSSNGAIEKTSEKVAELASKAKPPADSVRKTGRKVSGIASKAKTPLVAGGAALAGLAGGVALKSRTESKRPTKRFSSVQLPKSLKNIDLQRVIAAGRRVRSIGEQVGDVADTADKTRKKHK